MTMSLHAAFSVTSEERECLFPDSSKIYLVFSLFIQNELCRFKNQSLWLGGSNQFPLLEVASGWEECCYPQHVIVLIGEGWMMIKQSNIHPGSKEEF